jgi:hypothetical protein
MVGKRAFFTLNNVGDTLGKKKQVTKVKHYELRVALTLLLEDRCEMS